MVRSGLDRFRDGEWEGPRGARIGLLCHAASIDSEYCHVVDIVRERGDLRVLFGPQHGLYGQTQDNMIEWEGDAALPLPIFSLYGHHRKPTPSMLDPLDVLLIDLQDVGARYYTYAVTAARCMEACAELGIEVVVLDRPNPISGTMIEGNGIDPSFHSFVGYHDIPVRHGLTIGELLTLYQFERIPDCRLTVVPMTGWRRGEWFEQTGLPWVLPSPNMPTVDTAVVYPGICLLEATNISEGRGTTRPFELIGAPFVDATRLSSALAQLNLPGIVFRPCSFLPTFQKWAGKLCHGVQLHVTDRRTFLPYRTGLAVLLILRRLYPESFAWKPPPYEYEYEKWPIDILCGGDRIRRAIDRGSTFLELAAEGEGNVEAFADRVEKILLYPE